jgi:hypothetical protein
MKFLSIVVFGLRGFGPIHGGVVRDCEYSDLY